MPGRHGPLAHLPCARSDRPTTAGSVRGGPGTRGGAGMNEELDSQLSAMFDDELPEQQCELLAKRLARDEALKARWGRYAAIGSAIRSERGIRLDGSLAQRVSAAIATEAPLSVESE